MAAADAIMTDIMKRHERDLGVGEFRRFLTDFRSVIDHQRAADRDATSSDSSP